MADVLICSQNITFDYVCHACYDGYHGYIYNANYEQTGYNYDISGHAELEIYGPNNPVKVGDTLKIVLTIWDNHGGSSRVDRDSISVRFRGSGIGSSYYTTSNATKVSSASNIVVTWEGVRYNSRYSWIAASFSGGGESTVHGECDIYSGSFDLDIPISMTDPTASISASNVVAGDNATVKWSYSDADGDSVSTIVLERYYKAPGSSSWVMTRLIEYNSSLSAKSYTDAIPSDYVGGQVYYRLGFKDEFSNTLYQESSTYTVQRYNNKPTGLISISQPIIYNGKSVNISWSLSDIDGDTVTTTKLVRYYKTATDRSYSSVTLTTSNVKSYTDIIPESLVGGSVYYVVTFSDGIVSSTATSNTYTIEQSCNVNVIKNGIITPASDISVIKDGVITTMNRKLHSVVNGVIT